MVPSSTNKSPKNSKKIAVASNNGCSKKPRFDKYSRLLHRFFEALILLHVLGQTRGKHDTYPGDAFTPQEKPEAKTIISLAGDRRLVLEGSFTRRCIEFAKPRVEKEAKKLWKAMDEAGKKCLDLERNSKDIQLWRWLQQFRGQGPVDLCSLAYEQRRADEMKHMVTKIDTPQGGQGVRTASDVFYNIRHYIGRLAHHVRAPKQVLEDFACLEQVLDPYDIRLIDQVSTIEPPEADGHTTLEGIVKHKTYLNWGPPLLPGGANDPGFVQQRKLMNDMLVTIRKEALDQLRNKAGPLKWHPDSHTGITRSLASEPVGFGALRSVEDRLAVLDLDATDPNTSETEENRSVSPVYSSTSSVEAAGSSSQQSNHSSDDDDSDSEGGVSLS
ncbi:hypothetical protein DL766_006100 [Monosporascus sp. MC13-8B]|uniref:Prion-inhibition and propagation HeLo domain-containing protein n=1 Tax=Monosporascus cannonballus TaxID=155416 RepID=A0ABY0H665_9PEZI|nr:hypothetical protein DL763_009181 [Monosporascus cannonballus]RYO85950.1 hypothetical protein DL762_004967 [Monosporascus cannonballus]RYP28031.1 hypothetical protein DL766_006100 [Monosporascus sp. MC13-8B]